MKYFIVSDVHSFYDELIEALKNAGYDKENPEHIFVSLGDLFDRGPKACECLEFVNSLPEERKILITGNHEYYMDDAIVRKHFKSYDKHNKTDDTVKQFYKGFGPKDNRDVIPDHDLLTWMENFEEWKKYDKSQVPFFLLGEDKLFVHGWVPYWFRSLDDLRFMHWFDWYDASWENGFRNWFDYGPIHVDDKKNSPIVTVFCGHIHTSYAHSRFNNDGIDIVQNIPEEYKSKIHINNDPFVAEGIVGLDACTVLSGKVNCYILEI